MRVQVIAKQKEEGAERAGAGSGERDVFQDCNGCTLRYQLLAWADEHGIIIMDHASLAP